MNSPIQSSDSRRDWNTWRSHQAALRWATDHRIVLDHKSDWRLPGSTIPSYGTIHGLPTITGEPRITNGILVYLERADGQVFLAHLDWLEPVKHSDEPNQTKPTRKASRQIQIDYE